MMRETLSLLKLYHWKKSFWTGHYLWLIRQWGWKYIFIDTWVEIISLVKRKTGGRLAINPQGNKRDVYLWPWEQMPSGYRWF